MNLSVAVLFRHFYAKNTLKFYNSKQFCVAVYMTSCNKGVSLSFNKKYNSITMSFNVPPKDAFQIGKNHKPKTEESKITSQKTPRKVKMDIRENTNSVMSITDTNLCEHGAGIEDNNLPSTSSSRQISKISRFVDVTEECESSKGETTTQSRDINKKSRELMMKLQLTGPPCGVFKKNKTILPKELLQNVTENVQRWTAGAKYSDTLNLCDSEQNIKLQMEDTSATLSIDHESEVCVEDQDRLIAENKKDTESVKEKTMTQHQENNYSTVCAELSAENHKCDHLVLVQQSEYPAIQRLADIKTSPHTDRNMNAHAVQGENKEEKNPSSLGDSSLVMQEYVDSTAGKEDESFCFPFTDDHSDSEVCDVSTLFSDSFEKSYTRYETQKSKKNKTKAQQRGTSERNGDQKDRRGAAEGTDEKGKTKWKKPMPNYFVSIQMKNLKIRDGVQEVQDCIVKKNETLKPTLISLSKLHLTLFVASLNSEEEMERAKSALDLSAERLLTKFPSELVVVDIRGIGDFRNEVVFAKVDEGKQLENLKTIADTVYDCFLECGVRSTESRGRFKPHITIAKMSKAAFLRYKGIKKIPRDLYAEHQDKQFGYQVVTELQLCSMLKPKNPLTGYYQIEHQVSFAPTSRKLSTLSAGSCLSNTEAADIIVQWNVQSATDIVSKKASEQSHKESDVVRMGR